ncbi:MAG: GIY-YIG nuclease family protein [Gammaproteobacteria bacterium]|nr:GIY-YIG nuclease family protein [Gammaproteobacteria bacterium]MCH9743305.1 GIY-YIG nuclease family protein [Gammaproteobacteria bacterium]
MTAKTYYIYILECSNGNYYTGYTTDLERRYQEHLDGSDKCKYTRSFPPLRIAQYWEISGSASDAMKLEYAIKKLSKREKKSLIENPDTLLK